MKKNRSTTSSVDLPVTILFTVLTVLVAGYAHAAGASPKAAANKQKLKIVFLMGQSNMVGYSHPLTAWYLTQPMYVPPPEVATAKSRYYNPEYFYWKGLDFASGNSAEFNARGKALLAERRASRAHWRKLVYGNFGRNATRNDWLPEYGAAPKTGTKSMYPFLDKKAEEESDEYKMAEAVINRSCSNSGLHYFGSAKFLCLTGNAMARSLANLVVGGEPMIHKEAERNPKDSKSILMLESETAEHSHAISRLPTPRTAISSGITRARAGTWRPACRWRGHPRGFWEHRSRSDGSHPRRALAATG